MAVVKVGAVLMNGGAPHRTAEVIAVDKTRGTVDLQWSDQSDRCTVSLAAAQSMASGKRMANFHAKLGEKAEQRKAEIQDLENRYGYQGP